MTFFLYVLAFCIAIFVLILVHEAGHFLVARFFKVRVERFSIGFGKPFYTWKSKNGVTEYALAPIPLGGYVKLFDSRESKVYFFNRRFAFDHKPFWERIAIIFAGPLANILFAFFAFWLMFVIGFDSPKPIIGEVLPNSMASSAHMVSGEEIIQIDERITRNWPEVFIAMFARVGEMGNLVVTTKKDRNNFKKGVYHLDLNLWKLDDYNPDPLSDFGLVRYKPLVLPTIYKIVKGSPAENFGLKVGDRVFRVGDKNVSSWYELIRQIQLYYILKRKLTF